MIHRFLIRTTRPASLSNVIANVLDLEHAPVIHSVIGTPTLVCETEGSARALLRVKVFGLTFTNDSCLEFRPPNRTFTSHKSPFGSLTLSCTFREVDPGTPRVRCETETIAELDLPWYAYPFRRLVEWQLRRVNARINREDEPILRRRQRLYGDYVEDYLRDWQYLMCKEAFRRHFSRKPAMRG